jgi:hypothetical protein
VKLPESLRSLPPTGFAKTSSVDRPLPVPDWFYNNLPQNRSAWRLNDAQLSLGQEIDIPKDSDSAPVQFVAELTYIEQRNGRPISPGVQFSYTPRSADGKLSGLVYVKVGLPDQRIPKVGIWSLYDLTYQLYVKKVSHSPWRVRRVPTRRRSI